ncbi:hypothetical protein MKX03_036552 [Papaver bracteatum]|nr:hypothetical protein MKX03_036552 [Papaver bracteatum]
METPPDGGRELNINGLVPKPDTFGEREFKAVVPVAAEVNEKGDDPGNGAELLTGDVLEKFSLVTKFARDTTSQHLREIQSDTFSANDRKNRIPAPLSNNITEPENSIASVSDEIPVAADPHEWETFLDAEGRILDSTGLRKRIFYGGVEHRLRKEAWKFLLGYYGYDSTFAEREYLASFKKEEYETMKFTKFKERKGLIDKDVVRTDRTVSFYDGDDYPNVRILRDILLTYSFYNFDLGYCQGMSDLLSPILFVMKDEQESFWCFVALMERLGPNFNRDQAGMHSQLFALSKLVEFLDSPLHNYFTEQLGNSVTSTLLLLLSYSSFQLSTNHTHICNNGSMPTHYPVCRQHYVTHLLFAQSSTQFFL